MRLLKIGRDMSCDIVLHSENVSALHAELTLMNNGDILLEDKGSRNGTFIQNQAIRPGAQVNVRRGDAIRFGDVELQWGQVPLPEDNSAYKAIYGIGSHFNNDIQVSGGTVSRYHATIKVGRDGKVYIIDHSKNGTTVDGMKITPHTPYRIKKTSAVVCGGVPVNLRTTPVQWPTSVWKPILIAAACAVLLAGIGWGVKKLIDGRGGGELTDGELYARYNHSVVMLVGIYHYNITMGDLDLDNLNTISQQLGLLKEGYYFPSKVILFRDKSSGGINTLNASGASSKEIIEAFNHDGNIGLYSATGFFISDNGQLITNLHVVKPWLFEPEAKLLEEYKSQLTYKLSKFSEMLISNSIPLGLSAYISQLKVEGELDYIALIPQGDIFDVDNTIKCKVLSAGNDPNKDIALIQTVSKRMPASDCTYLNMTDSIETDDESLTVGQHVYTIGFPAGMGLQNRKNEEGIQVYAQGGDITQQNGEYEFSYNAATTGGASGSPVFNKYGMLIGVHHAGASQSLTQGYNYGIKAKYVKELLDSPHKVN
ncbi:MAG: FHA domain-containing protein [Bacteroidaceae bacterium]|nr:FHA domain-containing protein [Bacteroidaceae bacterium]